MAGETLPPSMFEKETLLYLSAKKLIAQKGLGERRFNRNGYICHACCRRWLAVASSLFERTLLFMRINNYRILEVLNDSR